MVERYSAMCRSNPDWFVCERGHLLLDIWFAKIRNKVFSCQFMWWKRSKHVFSDILIWKPYVIALFVCLPGLDKDSFVFPSFYPRYGTKVGKNVPLGCYSYCIIAKSRRNCLHFFLLVSYSINSQSQVLK